MSEQLGQEGTAGFVGQPAANDALTAGALLRRAREAAGLHVAALAVSLKVPVRKLEALEADRWDELPDAVFVRGLAASVCRTLKIDPQPVLDRLPQTSAPRLVRTDDGINTTFRAPSDGASPNLRDQLTRPVFLIVFALLLGALVLVLLPSIQQEDMVAGVTSSAQAVSTSQQVTSPTTSVVQPVGATGPSQALLPTAAASAMGTSTATLPAPAAAPAPAAGVVAAAAQAARPPAEAGAARPAAASSAAAAALTVANIPAAPASDIVVFHTKRASWVEVKDAKGVVAVRRVLAAGEAASASGALPLQVIIGRVDATEVHVRGRPFDLRPVSRDNVARFEVK